MSATVDLHPDAEVEVVKRKLRLLTIDDEPRVRESIAVYFEDSGYELLEAENGQIGLDVFRREKPDIILVDLRMPEVDGLEVVATVNKESPETPVIVVSGTGVLEDAIEAVRLGAWDYVTKPIYDMTALEHVVNKALDRAELLRENRRYREHLEDEVYKRTAELERQSIELRKANERLRKNEEELEQRVRERTAQLERTNRELESFSYSVSHDLRAPLRNIEGFSVILMEDCADMLDEKGQNFIKRIRNSVHRMNQLIEDLLQLSYIKQREFQTKRVNLSSLVRMIYGSLKGKQQRPPEMIIAENVIVRGDERFLQIALENLLGNALKFSSKKENARIEFGQLEEKEASVYFVRDNGAGFNMEYADKLFAPFQRMHAETEFEGTGIGLAIVQRIIHGHGGKIWAESETEKGTTFYFTLSGA